MSKCAVSIELESDAVVGGDVLRGEVVVLVSEDVRCDGLTLSMDWQTQGSGNPSGDTIHEMELFSGQWSGGQEVRYPFTLTVPEHPISYAGELVSVVWRLSAAADIPWSMDPKAEALFVLKPGPDRPEPQRTGSCIQSPNVLRSTGRILVVLPVVIGVLFACVGLAAAAGGAVAVTSGELKGALLAVLGVAAVILGLRASWRAVRHDLARKKLEALTIELSPVVVKPGEEVVVGLDFRPRKAILVREIRLRLVHRESATTGSGERRSTQHHDTVVVSTQVAFEQMLAGGESFSASRALHLPPDAALTFLAPDNRLRWMVQLDLDIDDWPDLVESHPIRVC